MKIFADRQGNVVALYRSATEAVHRDIYLLSSNDRGKTYQGKLLHKWNINACPMSSMDSERTRHWIDNYHVTGSTITIR